MKFKSTLFQLSALACLIFCAQIGMAQTIPVDPSVKIGTLENGMRYYIQKNSKPENRVELRLAVNAGAMQEDDDQQGLAHFVEHMAFNGSTHFKKNELVDYLESVGTKFGPDLNAYTSFDETVYMLQTRTDDQEILMKGLLVMEDWASGVAFDHEEIDKERGVVESEWRTRLSAQQRMQNTYFPVLYKDSRYAKRLPIGKPEIIRNADYETVKRFYRDWYKPELMAMIVVGDIDVAAMEQEVIKRFGKLKKSESIRKKKSNEVPDHEETLVCIVSDKEAPFTNIRMMYKHDYEKVKDFDAYRQQIVHRLYNTMLGARLDELAQGPNPPFTFSYTGYGGDVGNLASYESFAMVPEGESERALETLVTENERVLRHGFVGTELERAKTRLLTSKEKAYKEKDKTESRRFASRYVANFLDELPIPSIEDEFGWYKKYVPTITIAEVNALAKKWITDKNRVVVISGPEKSATTMPDKAKVLEILINVREKDIPPYVDKTIDAPLIAETLTPQGIAKVEKFGNSGITEMTLANGVKVFFKHTDFKNDEVMMRAMSPGGHSLYADSDYPQLQFAAQVIANSGLGEFDRVSLDKKLTGKVVRVSPWIGELYEGLRGSSSPDDLETMLQLAYLYFKNPRKDVEAMKSFVTRQSGIYKNLLEQPDYYFMDKVIGIQTQNHPRRGFPKEEVMNKMEIDRVFDLYKDRFADASDFVFFFVGNFDQSNFQNLIATYLGNLPSTNRKENWKDVNANYPDGRITERFNRGEAPKSQINLIWHGDFEWEEENRFDFNALVAVLRIKMRESMREDKGGVYGVGVRGNSRQFPKKMYSITVSFNADPPRVDELIQTALQDLANAKATGVDEKTLTKVKETMRQSRVKDLKENRFWMKALEDSYENGVDISSLTLDALDAKLDALTAEDIKAAANKYIDMNSMIEVVMMPEEPKKAD